MIHRLLYVSGAVRSVSQSDIADILAASRTNNARLGVTGLLLLADDSFIQVLEGERKTVRNLASRISRDARHRNFMVLVEQDAGHRAFAEWQMGFKRLDAERESDSVLFRTTRAALESRIAGGEGDVMLETVLAFAGEDFLAEG